MSSIDASLPVHGMKGSSLSTSKKRKHNNQDVAELDGGMESSRSPPMKERKTSEEVNIRVLELPFDVSKLPTEELSGNHPDQLVNGVEMDLPSSLSSPQTVVQGPSPSTKKKRKRNDRAAAEIEVDVDAPEPPSKKALRKAKKTKTTSPKQSTKVCEEPFKQSDTNHEDVLEQAGNVTTANRSGHGIWIGNLPWTTTKPQLISWLTENLSIEETMITRIHMPVPKQKPIEALRQKIQPENKGFAYIDFASGEKVTDAIALSEALFSGRRVLIKDAKSFDGRPEPLKEDGKAIVPSRNPQSKRVFVGNLPFDATTQELEEKFSKCGEILEVFMATFEDSGNCKGYAWIQFAKLESAVAAVRGWIKIEVEEDDAEDEDSEDGNSELPQNKVGRSPKTKTRKWWVNKIRGRELRREFGEDKTVRYKKRFGKDGSATRKEEEVSDPTAQGTVATPLTDTNNNKTKHSVSTDPVDDPTLDEHPRYPKRKDPRSQRNGNGNPKVQNESKEEITKLKALNKDTPKGDAARLTGAIVQAVGKKTTFA